MNTKFLIVLVCSVLGIQALHCSDEGIAVKGTAGAGGAEELSSINQQLFNALLQETVTVEEIATLLASGADVHARDSSGQTPLHCAVSSKSLRAVSSQILQATAIVELLLARGAAVDVNTQDNFGLTPLHYAARIHSPPAIFDLLLANGAAVDVNTQDNFGLTPLHYAALSHNSGALILIMKLLANDALVNVRSKRGKTPLHYAASSYSLQAPAIVDLLLKRGADADINAIDEDGQTPLDLATYAGNKAVINCLRTAIAHSESAAVVARGGDTALGGGGSAGAGDAGL